MADEIIAAGPTRNIPLQQRRQAKNSSSSLSRSSSADHPPGPSGKSQTQSTLGAALDPPGSGKGKAPLRSSSSKSTSMDPYSGSSRSNSMGRQAAVIDAAEEITYTPTTHRISKAKKGKKVHVCEYGCGKVFTRAEHRKRHEANHRTEPLYTCRVEECKKPFQRLDLLTRHEERQHGIAQPSGSVRSQRYRTSSPASSIATSSQPNSPAPTASMRMASPAASVGGTTPSAPAMSIGSLITPTTRGFLQQDPDWAGQYQNSLSTMPRGPYAPDLVYAMSATDDSPFHSSDSSYSPISETPHAQVHVQPYLPQYGKAGASSGTYPTEYNMNMITPMSVPDFGSWTTQEGSPQPMHSLGIGFEGQYPTPVGISVSASITHEHPVDSLADSSTPATSMFMERDSRTGVRVDQSFAAGLVASKDGLVNLDHETLQHYRDCYWKYFHPYFAVVHRRTTETGSLLDRAILAIGAQYSSRPHARSHSFAWFTFVSRTCATLEPSTITSQSALDSLRVIVLLEVLGLYRSKSSGVYKSAHFGPLYSSLMNDRALLSTDPAACIRSLPANADRNLLQSAYRYWVDKETRRRLVLAAFVIDTQRSTLFQQPRCQNIAPQGPALPVACSPGIWDCEDITIWFTLLSQPNSHEESIFTTSVLQCLKIIAPCSPDACSPLQNATSHALLMATYTPIQPLLIIAGESWLFARKIEDPTHWTQAKGQLRAWVESDGASQAVWHAGHCLRGQLDPDATDPMVGLHAPWCLYLAALVCWAYGFAEQPHFRQQSLSAQHYLAALQVPTWKELESMRGMGATRELLKSVRAHLLGKGNGALIAEGEGVLQRLIAGRSRLCWF